MRIGITGHRKFPETARAGIAHRLACALAPAEEAVSCLADGADQLFARLAVDAGVRLVAVLPADDYPDHLGGCEAVARYRALLDATSRTVRMPFPTCTDEAYEAAGRWVVDHADRLVAVWDGRPARGRGGTAEIVAYARARGVPVTVIWPPWNGTDPA
jgi:hypothetical protein